MPRRRVLDIEEVILTPDNLAKNIANTYLAWDIDRAARIEQWQELTKYIFATDTRQTTNARLPWKNSTTIPKLCQIRDNLIANYKLNLFPKRQFLKWMPDNEESIDAKKAGAAKDYISYAIEQGSFKKELDKNISDWVDYGNTFAMPVWSDESIEPTKNRSEKYGFVGPRALRLSPLDTVINPTASSIKDSPVIVRSWHTIGEFKKQLNKLQGEEYDEAMEVFNYMMEVRRHAAGEEADLRTKDEIYNIAGFNNYQEYLGSNFIEVLTFYGDLFDIESNELYENYIITVVDRHKLISKKPNDNGFGYHGIQHIGWRNRQDNLWAMGPLDNLVGLQYRLDHLENMKADVLDLTVFPPIKIKGLVEDFQWAPGERIYIQDDGDAELMAPDTAALNVNIEMQSIMMIMEEMAGAPKEALGFRTPGEKTAYEIQRLENASNRIYQNRINDFEENFMEPLLNAMLELGRRKAGQTSFRVFDDENKVFTFRNISTEDLSSAGKIRPIGARHFVEQAELVQNLTNFANSPIGQDPLVNVHLSGIKTAKLFEDILGVQDYNLFSPYVRIAEQQKMQSMMATSEEQTATEIQTPAGLTPDDYDEDLVSISEEEDVPSAA